MSSTYSYPIAMTTLTQVEKDRIVCTYLNSTEPSAVDWEKATSEYGAASVDSYKKGMQNTMKKIKKAMDSGVVPEAAEATPAKKGGKGGKKRDADGEGDAEETPKKKKGRKSKAQKEAEAAAAEADEDGVKAEQED